jgi:hypothetical protein
MRGLSVVTMAGAIVTVVIAQYACKQGTPVENSQASSHFKIGHDANAEIVDIEFWVGGRLGRGAYFRFTTSGSGLVEYLESANSGADVTGQPNTRADYTVTVRSGKVSYVVSRSSERIVVSSGSTDARQYSVATLRALDEAVLSSIDEEKRRIAEEAVKNEREVREMRRKGLIK